MISKFWYVDCCIYHTESHFYQELYWLEHDHVSSFCFAFAVAILAIHRKRSFYVISLKAKSSPLNPIIELLAILTSMILVFLLPKLSGFLISRQTSHFVLAASWQRILTFKNLPKHTYILIDWTCMKHPRNLHINCFYTMLLFSNSTFKFYSICWVVPKPILRLLQG